LTRIATNPPLPSRAIDGKRQLTKYNRLLVQFDWKGKRKTMKIVGAQDDNRLNRRIPVGKQMRIGHNPCYLKKEEGPSKILQRGDFFTGSVWSRPWTGFARLAVYRQDFSK
jgi:hypothetical protein